jgi:hypothetical protein
MSPAAMIEPAPMKINVKVPMNSATPRRIGSLDMAANLEAPSDGQRD